MMPPCNVISDTVRRFKQTYGCAAAAAAATATAVTAAALDCPRGRTQQHTPLNYREPSVDEVLSPCKASSCSIAVRSREVD
jgi:hypothetical protein